MGGNNMSHQEALKVKRDNANKAFLKASAKWQQHVKDEHSKLTDKQESLNTMPTLLENRNTALAAKKSNDGSTTKKGGVVKMQYCSTHKKLHCFCPPEEYSMCELSQEVCFP